MVVLIQARMGGTRWPGKVMQYVDGRPMLERVVRAVEAGMRDARIIVATTTAPQDEAVERFAHTLGVGCICGDDEPRKRMLNIMAGIAPTHQYLMRVCADQPLLDWKLAEPLLAAFNRYPGFEYYGFHVAGWPVVQTYLGQAWEIARVSAIRQYDTPEAREHVTYELYSRPDSKAVMVALPDWVPLRHGTVDVPEDVARIEAGDLAVPLKKAYAGRCYA